MTEIHGVTGAPYQTPQVRKKMPPPFARPLVDLDGTGRTRREWKDTSVLDIQSGDTVAGFGVVRDAVATFDAWGPAGQSLWRVRLSNVLGEHRDFPGHERLFAFTPDE